LVNIKHEFDRLTQFHIHAKKGQSKLQFLGDNFYLATVTETYCNRDKKIVKATKNNKYFTRYGCILYKSAIVSVTDICQVIFLRVDEKNT